MKHVSKRFRSTFMIITLGLRDAPKNKFKKLKKRSALTTGISIRTAQKQFRSAFIEITLGLDGVSKTFKKETNRSKIWSEISIGRALPPN